MTRYSIITPVYNRSDCIGRCIESVINNLKAPLEVEHIIVDDGSTDNTPIIIKQYANKYPHIKYIQFTKNKGTNAARNAAIKKAQGDFCIILDSDDYFINNAIQIINTIISQNHYNYYMFCPNDMINYYNNNSLLNNNYQKELTYKDFLLNNINGDFVHVMPTSIIQRLPFDENLRIYEGVFFLRFYKEVGKMLFTKEIVTIRERSRNDSVTREIFKTEAKRIQRSILAINLKINWFKDDYIQFNHKEQLNNLYIQQIENYILLSQYEKVKEISNKVILLGFRIPIKYRILYLLRIGFMYNIITKLYFIVKYSLCKSKLK